MTTFKRKPRRAGQKTLDRLATKTLQQVAAESECARGVSVRAFRDLTPEYVREMHILERAIGCMMMHTDHHRIRDIPSHEARADVQVLLAMQCICNRIQQTFVESPHCLSLREAPNIAAQFHFQNYGLEDAFSRVIAPLQYSGTPAERAVATWFWHRYLERLQANCTGSPI